MWRILLPVISLQDPPQLLFGCVTSDSEWKNEACEDLRTQNRRGHRTKEGTNQSKRSKKVSDSGTQRFL